MEIDNLISSALAHAPFAISYETGRALTTAFPDKEMIAVPCGFDVERYAKHGHCTLTDAGIVHNRIITSWSKKYGIHSSIETGVFDAKWEGHDFVVVILQWPNPMHGVTEASWILGKNQEMCEAFYAAVSEWSSTVRGEVLVFMEGGWHRSEELFHAIQSASFDNLILPPDLDSEIRTDIDHFLASRDVYERYGIPWKRGVLLMGPPGNGKTHAVKALINRTRTPCLYVKSFKQRYGSEHANIRSVFERARETTPCLLVLEDLDTLLTDSNRSFFLNEMDGFEANTGVIVLATTNHPERLDPAIVDRPSRFDRKYHFQLPAEPERARYLLAWNNGVEPDLRLSDDALTAVTEATEGFSFAYLKELCLSAMMRWIASPATGAMDNIMLSQTGSLRAQMGSDPGPVSVDVEADEDDDED